MPDLLKMNLVRGGVKRIKYSISSPQRAQNVLFVSETGVVSIETLPMDTGYCFSDKWKMGWQVEHDKMVFMPGIDEPLLPISERSFYPLSPQTNHNRSKEDIEQTKKALNELADVKYSEAFSRLEDEKKTTPNERMINTIMYICGAIAIVAIISGLLMNWGS